MILAKFHCIQPDNIKSEMFKGLKSNSAWKNFSTSNWFTIYFQRYKDYLQSYTTIRKQMDDKGLPAPPGGLSEELQRLNYLQMQKCFTVALLVSNIISGAGAWRAWCLPPLCASAGHWSQVATGQWMMCMCMLCMYDVPGGQYDVQCCCHQVAWLLGCIEFFFIQFLFGSHFFLCIFLF